MRFFTSDQIRGAKIPSKQDIRDVLAFIKQTLSDSEYVLAAQFYGSTARGDFNELSDVDVLLIYQNGADREIWFDTCKSIVDYARERHVEVNFNMMSELVARSNTHPMPARFLPTLHVALDKDGYIVGYPLEYIVYGEQSLAQRLQECRAYIESKYRKLGDGPKLHLLSEADTHIFLEDMYNALAHIPRTVLYVLAVSVDKENNDTVIKKFSTHFSKRGNRALHDLLILKKSYKDTVLTHSGSRTWVTENYQKFLDEFIQSTLDLLVPFFEETIFLLDHQ